MNLARGVWFVVSMPFRVGFWLVWQIRRAVYAAVGGVVRIIGQRNFILAFASATGLCGLGMITGVVECHESLMRACLPEWEVAKGFLLIGIGAFIAVMAVRHVPNDRRLNFRAEDDIYRYRAEDWRLSWTSVLTVVMVVAILYAVLLLSGRL